MKSENADGGRSKGYFQAKVGLLTIESKDNMFSIKVTLSGNDLQPAMTCSHSVKNIGQRPTEKPQTKISIHDNVFIH